MLKKYNKFFILLLIIPCLFLLSACKEEEKPAQEYSISYELNGGINNSENPNKYVSGSGDGVIFKDPTKTGYEFLGWFSDENLTNKVLGIESTMTGDVKIYAGWKLATYTISYILDGGENSAYNPTSYDADSGEIKLQSAYKVGYEFEGWYTSAEFVEKVTKIEAGRSENITLYAKFSVRNYLIQYELYGGTNNPDNLTQYNILSPTITLLAPTKEGYNFAGWFLSEDMLSTQRITGILSGSIGHMKLFAKWEPIVYSLTYHIDESVVIKEFTIEDEISPLFAPNKVGYNFIGWYLSEKYADDELVSKIELGTSQNVDLYAKFTPKTFKIYFNYDGADGGEMPESLNVVFDSLVGTLPVPTKTGYEFLGWWSESVKYDSTTIYKVNGNLILSAHWKIDGEPTPTYSITFDSQGGSEVESILNIEHGEKIPEFTQPTKNGYYLEGWLYNSKLWDFETDLVTKNINLVASWKLVTYEINYNLDGGTNSESNPLTYTIESDEIVFDNATKTGYVFIGWFYESTFENEAIKIEAGSTGNVELFANFRKIETGSVANVSISYNLPRYLSHIYADEQSKRPVDSFVSLSTFDIYGISEYFEGYYYIDPNKGETLIVGNSYHIISSDDLHIYAKWNYNEMEKYFYTDKLVFEIDESNSFAIVKYYDGRSSVIVIPKLYNYNGVDYEVRVIGENCFLGNKNISKVFINADLVQVEKSAFESSSVSAVDFSKISSIAESAFKATLISEFIAGENLTFIGKKAFADSGVLVTVNLSGANEMISSILEDTFRNCVSLENVNLKSTIISIGSYAFAGCSSLKNIDFLQNIASQASLFDGVFADCVSLSSVVIPVNIESIEVDLFTGCSSLTEIKLYRTFHNRFTDTFSSLFGDFPVEKVEFLGDLIISVPDSYFAYNETLKEFIMSDSVCSIGDEAFYECYNLEIIKFSKSFKTETFSVSDFYGTKWLNNLKEIIIIDNVVVYVPNNEEFVNVTLPDNVVAISSDALSNNTFIEQIFIPKNVQVVSSRAFNNAINLRIVTFENGSLLDRVDLRAFYGCKKLQSINLENCENLTTIGNEVFGYVSADNEIGLTLKFPDSLQSIGKNVFYRANILNIQASGDNFETDENGVLYKTELISGVKEKTALIFYPSSVLGKVYVVPSTVSVIYASAFVDIKSKGSELNYILISNDVTIQGGAFYNTIVTILNNNASIKFENSYGNPADYLINTLDLSLYSCEKINGEYVVTISGEVNNGYYFISSDEATLIVFISNKSVNVIADVTESFQA